MSIGDWSTRIHPNDPAYDEERLGLEMVDGMVECWSCLTKFDPHHWREEVEAQGWQGTNAPEVIYEDELADAECPYCGARKTRDKP